MNLFGRPPCIPNNTSFTRRLQARSARLETSTICHATHNPREDSRLQETAQAVPDPSPLPSFLQRAASITLAAVCSVSIVLYPGLDAGGGWSSAAVAEAAEAYSVAAYEQAVAGRRDGGDDGPNLALFTEDAQQAMSRLRQYRRFVESMSPSEEACGFACSEDREVLEQAWQVVASEHYSANGTFSQTAWADTLLRVLKSHGGLLPTKSDLQAAISDLLDSLGDPYTEFLPPSAFRRALRRPLPQEQSYLRAQYVGLGLELGPVAPGGGRVVLAPLAGSPAETAGIRRGDTLISIDGTQVDQLRPDQVRALMRGPAGSTATLEWIPSPTASAGSAMAAQAAAAVEVEMSRQSATGDVPMMVASPAGSRTPAQLLPLPSGSARTAAAADAAVGPHVVIMDVERRDLPQPAVKVSTVSMGSPGSYVTYIRLLYFGSETSEGLEAALRRHEGDPGNMGYMLDLRNNPGGVFEEAIACASLFLERGDVITKTIRGPVEVVDTVWQVGNLPSEVFPSLPGHLASKPVVLLANRSTASASEVFIGALRDNGRAALLGERTFGKGLVQYYFPLREGKDGGLRVTVAKYVTPSGYDISDRREGLVPQRTCTDFPHEELPTSPQQSDECVLKGTELLAKKAS